MDYVYVHASGLLAMRMEGRVDSCVDYWRTVGGMGVERQGACLSGRIWFECMALLGVGGQNAKFKWVGVIGTNSCVLQVRR